MKVPVLCVRMVGLEQHHVAQSKGTKRIGMVRLRFQDVSSVVLARSRQGEMYREAAVKGGTRREAANVVVNWALGNSLNACAGFAYGWKYCEVLFGGTGVVPVTGPFLHGYSLRSVFCRQSA